MRIGPTPLIAERLQTARWWRDPWLWVIGAIAAFLRCYRPGLYKVVFDEVNLLYWAQQIAWKHHVLWVSNNWLGFNAPGFPLANHSPINNYLLAIPYLLTTDPTIVRLFIAILNVVACLLLYGMTKRYAGPIAAITGGLLFAVAWPVVENSRFVFHTSMATIFIAGWAFSGLLGYYEGKRGFRYLHWLLLACAAQFHPAIILLAGPSLYLLIAAWWRGENRRQIALDTLLGGALAALTFIPWILGTFGDSSFRVGIMAPPVTDNRTIAPTIFAALQKGFGLIALLTSGVGMNPIMVAHFNWSVNQHIELYWPPHLLNVLSWSQFGVIVLSSAVVLVRGMRRKTPGNFVPLRFWALVVSYPLLVSFLPVELSTHYFVAVAYGAFPLLGCALAYLWSRLGRYSKYSIVVWAMAVAAVQIWMSVGIWHWYDENGTQGSLSAPMDSFRNVVKEWSASGTETVILIDSFEDPSYNVTDSQQYFWQVISAGEPVRIVPRYAGQGIPLAPTGTRLVSFTQGQTLPTLFPPSDGAVQRSTFGTFASTSPSGAVPVFQVVEVPAGYVPTLQYQPRDLDTFSVGAQIVGIHAEAQPTGGEPWPIVLVWRTKAVQTDQTVKFSIRAVVGDQQIAQADFSALDLEIWREGDLVLNPFTLQLPATLPAEGVVRLQVIMYTYPAIQNANVLDRNGNAAGQWLFVDVRP